MSKKITATILIKPPFYTKEVDDTIELYQAEQRLKGKTITKPQAAAELILRNSRAGNSR